MIIMTVIRGMREIACERNNETERKREKLDASAGENESENEKTV